MKHIIGMAKSCLDVKGSKARNLELDFLHLALAVSKSHSSNAEAQGVLLVLDDKVWRRAERWRRKYGVVGDIEVVLATPTARQMKVLRAEKTGNARANRRGANSAEARATKSAAIAEAYLREEIQKRFPSVRKQPPQLPHLCCVSWDFYGVEEVSGGTSC